MAQRVILELKDKIKTSEAINSEMAEDIEASDTFSEAVSALTVLGYSAQEAKQAVSKSSGNTLEELIKNSLKRLMR